MDVASVTIDDLSGDPHQHLARLRATAPVAWVPALGAFLVVGRDSAVEVLRDPGTYTVDDPRFSTARVVGQSMLSRDGDEHARHRQPFVDPFRPRRVVERFGAFVDEQIDRRLSAVEAGGRRRAELRDELASPLAAAVVAHSLGLDGGDEGVVDRLVGWYREIVPSVSGTASGHDVTVSGTAAMSELGESLRERLGSATSSGSLLTDAVSAGGVSEDEVISNAGVIMFGGIETTEGMILNLLWHVLGDEQLRDEIAGDPDLVDAAVEESLRLEPAAAVVDRYATQAVTLGGVEIVAGAMVTVSLAGANRDPAEFPDPDRFELRRPNARRHLAFAAGPHVCVGMDLARLEARSALRALLVRFPRARIEPGGPPPTGLVFRKPARLPATW